MDGLQDRNMRCAVVRLDRFVVPGAARDEFLMRVGQTHDILRTQDGFIRDLLLERPGDAGASVIVTLVEWDSRETVERVVPVVRAAHARMGFDARETMARLGISAEMGTYAPIAGTTAAAG
ncbi:antibiotic biosynthesis monooxygenase [Mesorhizobium sp. ZMM04-5]|uniref:Antibiotic biosynthesis monooxygenase n=1 Tax=Mesorhizobium marinum TaxID=3228790 RepID=A0ABV3R237_9HYPH